MAEWLSELNYWHWLAFGLALLAVELLGVAGYFLWLGISALAIGLLMLIMPIGWQLQWLSFASFSLMTTWLWWRKQHKIDIKSDDARTLNQKQKQLVGQVIRLEEDIQAGKNRIKVGDTTWAAMSEQDISKGENVEIVRLDGIILHIKIKKN
ncbi:NfeD family protein [Vibrio sonorensis]|uniref:NfeD family protein n=1 Tax=Vibrio sonorensis TaxID=1004316 RepID=UPI0008DAB13A|nr:NfeD family protein [Vibrio sonorensis]